MCACAWNLAPEESGRSTCCHCPNSWPAYGQTPIVKASLGAKRHLTARGNGRAAVFLKPGDCERFMERLDAALDKSRAV